MAGRCFPVFPKVDAALPRGLMAPPGLTALGAKGSACDRLRLTGGLRALALGSYIVSLRWRGTAPSAPFLMPPLAAKTIQPPCGRRKCIPPLVAGATTFPPQFGGAAKGKRLNGQARRLTSPHLEVLCRTSTVAL